jgi:hypothetical protein
MQLYAQNIRGANDRGRVREDGSRRRCKTETEPSKRRLKTYTSTVFHKIFHNLVESSDGLKVSL